MDRHLRRWLGPAAALGLCACAIRPAAFFPVGMYGVNIPLDLGRLRREGFNAAQTYRTDPAFLKALAGAARQAGMRLLADPFSLMAASVPAAAFPLAAWYLADEPDASGMPAAELCGRAARARSWSAGATAFVAGQGGAAAAYRDCADIVMVDWYPVPHLPLESAGEQVLLAAAAAGGKPVWAVLQAMDWRDYPQRDPRKPRIGRFPSLRELRFMAYHALLEGAEGIWFYTYSKPGGKTLVEFPEQWSALTSVVRELSALRPVLERGRPIVPPFASRPGGVLAKAWRYRLRDYVVIVSPGPAVMRPVPKELLKPGWRPLFAVKRNQRELLAKVGDGYYLPPYAVMVFESRLRF